MAKTELFDCTGKYFNPYWKILETRTKNSGLSPSEFSVNKIQQHPNQLK